MTTPNDQAVDAFVSLLQRFRASDGEDALTNFTFWCGAGFSKSWNPAYPTGEELFRGNATWKFDLLPTVCRSLGVESSSLRLQSVKEVVYALDMYRRYADLRPRYVDDQLIDAAEDELVRWVQANLEAKVSPGYWKEWKDRFPLPDPLSPDQKSTLRLIRLLMNMGDGSKGRATGVRPHFLTTNYDFVIETILNGILADDDSLFLYTYRGFTPTEIRHVRHVGVAHQHWLVTNHLKLNGGLEVRPDRNRYCLDYSRETSGTVHGRPKIILPSREQDYSDPYFLELFRKAVRLLRETTVLVVVGYSFPEEDALLRFLVRQFAECAEDGVGKALFYVDPQPATTRVSGLFGPPSFGAGPDFRSFVGTWGEFAASVMARV